LGDSVEGRSGDSGRWTRLSRQDLARTETQHSCVAPGWFGRLGFALWQLAARKPPHGQRVESARVRFSFQLREGNSQFGAWGGGISRRDDLAMGGLPAGQGGTESRATRR